MDSELQLRKLKPPIKTRFVSKVIMFEENLEFKVTIVLCYGKKKTLSLQERVLKAQVWAIVRTINMYLNPMVSTCVWNQSKGH